MKDITTQKPSKFENKKVPFLKLIDTKGIEIQPQYGVSAISEEIIKIINDPKELEKYENNKIQNFLENNNEISVQCVWYCVTGSTLEKEEKEFINNIKMQKNKILIIIVYIISEDVDKRQKMRYHSKDIPYVEVVSKDDEEEESFRLDKLINITIEKCKSLYESELSIK